MAIDFANLDPSKTFRPRVTCLEGKITALRPFVSTDASTPENSQLIQNDIPSTKGTSGSAITDDEGRVVAVNSWGTTDEGGSNRFAPRADLLLDMLSQVQNGSLSPLIIEEKEDQPENSETENPDVPETDSSDEDESINPDTNISCPSLGYYNNTFLFGFTPPVSFSGPYQGNYVNNDLLSVKFITVDGETIFIHVAATSYYSLDNWASDWSTLRMSNGDSLWRNEWYVMPNGRELVIFEWLAKEGHVCIEAYALADGYLFGFSAYLLTSQRVEAYESNIFSSFQTICVE
jgi:hypothetical protein